MSWQLAAFSILALGLAGGFAWYERTRPDARLVALVGTLAAFAVLGRIAFAAVPNVKPTTDIVLIAGYALGGAPGFMVGALAGLTSNFFFGQGPWTPWQMAAWGVTGMLGTALALAMRRRPVPNRWVLASFCGAVGFAFTAVQDFGDWVTYSDHSIAQLGVYLGKGVGFDFVHAAGCVAFALAFGPALAHSVNRFAARIQVTWGPRAEKTPTSSPAIPPIGVLVLIAGASAIALAGQAARPGSAVASGTPQSYLLSAQNADGGFGPAPGSASSELYSGWAALGLAAAGYNPQAVRHGGASLASYIQGGAASSTDPGSLERTILALRAAGLPASTEVAQLRQDIKPDGSVSGQVNLTSFGILALRAAGQALPPNMTAWLARQQDSDGGFNFASRGGSSDIDDTGGALEALAGMSGTWLSRAVDFIGSHENRDGGFPSQPGGPSNAQSTAWAIQGLIAARTGPTALARPLAYLRSLTAPDGHIAYAQGSDQTPVWVTSEALMALAGKPLPLAPVTASHPTGRVPSSGRRASARRTRAVKRRRRRLVRGSAAITPLRHAAAGLALLDALLLAPVSDGRS